MNDTTEKTADCDLNKTSELITNDEINSNLNKSLGNPRSAQTISNFKSSEYAKGDEPISPDLKSNEHTVLAQEEPLPDPYAYIHRNGFTSEMFKIEIKGLPRYFGLAEFKKLMHQLNLNCNKVKTPSGSRRSMLFACFRSEKERDEAINILSGYKWKGSTLSVKVSRPVPDPLVKRKLEELNSPNKKPRIETKEEQTVAIQASSSPLCNLPYEDQLKQKAEDAKSLLRKLGEELIQVNPSLKKYFEEQRKSNDGLPCKMLDIRHSDNYSYYRNKCEFTIGKDDLTGEKCIGFRLGTYALGSVGVAPVDSLLTVPQIMKDALKIFEKFVKSSKLDVFSPVDLSGYWKQLTLRLAMRTKQLMVIIGLNPQNLLEQDLSELKQEIANYYQTEPDAMNNVKSVYLQQMRRKQKGSGFPEFELILGEPFIEEILCDLRFSISPGSFFQINTECAEVLINSVKELSRVNKETTVVDVCCGTGTIGLCLAKDCSNVLGVEIIEEAVRAAKENAVKNDITNAQFFCGKADEILSSVFNRVPDGKEILAIVDPPRAGLHQNAIHMLRRNRKLNRLVFMSCDGKAAFKNFVELCRAQSKTLQGSPFVPVAAVPVDLFPHTNYYELVIYFERQDFILENCKEPKMEPQEVKTEDESKKEDNINK